MNYKDTRESLLLSDDVAELTMKVSEVNYDSSPMVNFSIDGQDGVDLNKDQVRDLVEKLNMWIQHN